jgi:hypothetical protein
MGALQTIGDFCSVDKCTEQAMQVKEKTGKT